MARPKSYDREEALHNACNAFWQHGYSALGVRAIEKQTNLNQFAIRESFGGKEGLYAEALRLYVAETDRHVIASLRTGTIAEVDRFFADLADLGSQTASPWGCLIVNAGLENAVIGSTRIAEITQSYWRSLEDAFTTALQRSKANGEIADDLDTTEAATALTTAVMGIHTKNRTSASVFAGIPLCTMVRKWIARWRVL